MQGLFGYHLVIMEACKTAFIRGVAVWTRQLILGVPLVSLQADETHLMAPCAVIGLLTLVSYQQPCCSCSKRKTRSATGLEPGLCCGYFGNLPCLFISLYIYIYTHVCMCVCVYIYTYVVVHIYIYIYICTCIYISVCNRKV